MNVPQPIPRPSLHDQLVEQLRTFFTEGPLKPGDKINEKELCAAYGVSRTPLREALKVMASEGLVNWTPNRGARVAEIDAEGLAEVFDVLMALEQLAGQRACASMDDAAIAAVAALQEQMEAEYRQGDISAYFRTNQAIHDGNPAELRIPEHEAIWDQLLLLKARALMT